MAGIDAPSIEATLEARDEEDAGLSVSWLWKHSSQEWVAPPDATSYDELEADFRPPTLVLYARIDGSYAVFDSYYATGRVSSFAAAAIRLTPAEVWDGQETRDGSVSGGKRTVIGGLIADWVSWQQREVS